MVHLSRQARIAIGKHIADVDVGSLTIGRLIVEHNNYALIALVKTGGSQGLTIIEQVTVEGILGHTVHLGRTAGVVDGTVSKRTFYIVLVHNHLIITGEVKRVEVGLIATVQAKFARIHNLLTGVLGLVQVTVGTLGVFGHILAVVTLIEANLGLHGQGNPLVESGA